MNELARQLEQYLWETLGIRVSLRTWDGTHRLPQYLRDGYTFFLTRILETDFVLMVDARQEEQTPAVVAKQLGQVKSRHDLDVIYVRSSVTSHNRRRLIGQRVPFIVPGNQMYLPMLGIDLREHFKQLRQTKPRFSPSVQALVLYVLWGRSAQTITPAEVAHQLGYSRMTMTRAFDELEAAGVGEQSTQGKERHLRFDETGSQLWERARPYLDTPVAKRLYVASSAQIEGSFVAGESALARYTALAEPKVPALAFSTLQWKTQRQRQEIVELDLPEPGAFEIELWKYSPAQFAREGIVDRLSLYLSLSQVQDERVQSALDVLMEAMAW